MTLSLMKIPALRILKTAVTLRRIIKLRKKANNFNDLSALIVKNSI